YSLLGRSNWSLSASEQTLISYNKCNPDGIVVPCDQHVSLGIPSDRNRSSAAIVIRSRHLMIYLIPAGS
ncbi:MAG TPA: hypothetical protein VGC87_19630, partial [Pyrinomonadaceae bacterium]